MVPGGGSTPTRLPSADFEWIAVDCKLLKIRLLCKAAVKVCKEMWKFRLVFAYRSLPFRMGLSRGLPERDV
jgi:hypothetical protein